MQFWREIQISGGPDGPDPPDGAGGAGGHLGGGASIRSSPDGQDEAIDTPTTLLPSLPVHMCGLNPAFLYGCQLDSSQKVTLFRLIQLSRTIDGLDTNS